MNEAIRIGMYKKMQEAIMYCMRYFSPLLLIYWLTKIKSFSPSKTIQKLLGFFGIGNFNKDLSFALSDD